MEDDFKSKAIIGGQIGGNLKLRFEKFSVRNFLGLQYTNYKYEPATEFKDDNGQFIGIDEKNIRNFSLQYSPIFTYDFNNGIFIGAGSSFSLLLKSQYNNTGIGNNTEKLWSNNYQYRKLNISAPIVLGFEWKRSSLFMSYSFGISNRNAKEAFIKERENNILLGYNLVIGKKKVDK